MISQISLSLKAANLTAKIGAGEAEIEARVALIKILSALNDILDSSVKGMIVPPVERFCYIAVLGRFRGREALQFLFSRKKKSTTHKPIQPRTLLSPDVALIQNKTIFLLLICCAIVMLEQQQWSSFGIKLVGDLASDTVGCWGRSASRLNDPKVAGTGK